MKKEKTKENRKSKKRLVISLFSIITFFLFFSVIFAVLQMGNNKIMIGVKIENIDVSNLTKQEAIEKIQQWYEEKIKQEIKLKYQEIEETIQIEQFDPVVEIEQAVDEAYKVGRSGNIVQDNYTILSAMLTGKKIELSFQIDEEKLNQKIEEISAKLPNAVVESNYYIEEDQLIIKKGTKGIQIKEEELKEKIKETYQTEGQEEIQIPVQEVEPEAIDLQKIHDEIYKEPQDAYVSQDPVQVHPHVNGVDFAISMEEAQKLLEEEKEEYVIPLTITVPEKTTENLGEEAFPTVLGEFTTRYDASNKNRSNNLEIASEKIDGTVILPGETFSYNKIVGERTIAEGYKEAAVYSGGKVVEGIGGGICQLSSTLYNAVLYANLEIVSRSNHRFLTSYVDAGRDATVSWGTIDFQFKNTRSYPIKVVSTVKNGVVNIQIKGIQEEKEYIVTIQSTVTETIPYTTNTIEDNTIPKGTTVIEQNGANGAKSVTYKIVSYNGIEVERTLLSNDTYSALEKIIRKGTKEEVQTSTQASQDTTEQTNMEIEE